MHEFSFTVDAKLLRELGERLVGRPHIALAELIKNSYDADATIVEIELGPQRIVVSDNGHGMSLVDFASKWMRIGTTHKADSDSSPAFSRELTGSKGVGRLAAQLLARKIRIISCASLDPSRIDSPVAEQIVAPVNWDEAISAGTLTEVAVQVEVLAPIAQFPGGSAHGTRLELEGLTTEWAPDDFRRLAQEIWSLQSPFGANDEFKVVLNTEFEEAYRGFSEQMTAILDIWNGRITGRLRELGFVPPVNSSVGVLPATLPRNSSDAAAGLPEGRAESIRVAKELPDRYLEATIRTVQGDETRVYWLVPRCEIHRLRLDIRVFDLQRRQPAGIRVDVARSYLRRFGGIGIYDGKFRLPYYGADVDWLNIASDVAGRLTASGLLPDGMNVNRGLLSLPGNANLFGQAFVSTSFEEKEARRTGSKAPTLDIQVTRDRLVDNDAYQRLRVMLRAPIDAYAMVRAREVAERVDLPGASSARPRPGRRLESLRKTLTSVRDQLPAQTYKDLSDEVDLATRELERVERESLAFTTILGALATAGITSLAYEHELSKQIRRLEAISASLIASARSAPVETSATLLNAATEIDAWTERAEDIRKMFAPLVDEEDRETVKQFRATEITREVIDQVHVLAKSVKISTSEVDQGLMLPRANLPAWSAVLQNLLVNSFNSLVSNRDPQIKISSRTTAGRDSLLVQDNGVGVDLADAERLWNPFQRGKDTPVSPDHVLGGTGLGLTIVRMICREIGVDAKFIPPETGYSAAVELSWKAT